jgi:hypothetical protein
MRWRRWSRSHVGSLGEAGHCALWKDALPALILAAAKLAPTDQHGRDR